MSEIREVIRILLWGHRVKQEYLIKSKKHTLPEILDIIAYIQKINDEACSSFMMSALDVCSILVYCFGFEFDGVNYYEMTCSQKKQAIGKVKELNYSCMKKNSSRTGAISIELTDFWELYNGKSIPKEAMGNSEIEEIIKATVRNNPDAQPWLDHQEGKLASRI